MTTDPARLLQMLEPTVRPGGGAPASAAGKAQTPFENRSFQDLLSQASTQPTQPAEPSAQQPVDADGQAGQAGKAGAAAQPANPLGGLSGLGQVENAALRQVLMQAGRQGNHAG